MARKPGILPADSPAAVDLENTAEGQGDPAELDAVLAQCVATPGEDRWQVAVYEASGPTPRANGGSVDSFCFKLDAADAENLLERIQQELGGGLFRVRILRNGKFNRMFTVSVRALPKAAAAPAPAAAPENAVMAAINPVLDRFASAMTIMAEQNQRIIEAIATRKPEGDSLEQFQKFAGIMRELKGTAGETSADTMRSVFQQGFDLAKTVLAERPGNTTVMDLIQSVIESVGPTVGGLITSALATRAGLQLPAPGGGAGSPPALTDQAAELNRVLLDFVAQLAERARAGDKPSDHAQWVRESLPEPLLAMLLTRPGVLNELAATIPDVNQHKEWFGALIMRVKEIAANGASHELGSTALGARPVA